ncbi:MAG: DUF3343 domain-containing protein [Geobacteraceae bacterium]|nr:DUF3343 domain-containing protein [Geobacteraceae bacterium]
MGQQVVSEGQYLAVFNSTHRVLKAEGLLKNSGLPIMLIPAPRAVQADCGLAIRFDEDHLNVIIALLTEQNLLPAFLCQFTNNTYVTIREYQHENH